MSSECAEGLFSYLSSVPEDCALQNVEAVPILGHPNHPGDCCALDGWHPPTGCTIKVNPEASLQEANGFLQNLLKPPTITALFKVRNIVKLENCRLSSFKMEKIWHILQSSLPHVTQSYLNHMNKHLWVDDRELIKILKFRLSSAQRNSTGSGIAQYPCRGSRYDRSEAGAWPLAFSSSPGGPTTTLFSSELGAHGRIGLYVRKIPSKDRLVSITKWASCSFLRDGTFRSDALRKRKGGGGYCFSTWKYKYFVLVECQAQTKTCDLYRRMVRGEGVGKEGISIGAFAKSTFYSNYLKECHENSKRLAFTFSKCIVVGLYSNVQAEQQECFAQTCPSVTLGEVREAERTVHMSQKLAVCAGELAFERNCSSSSLSSSLSSSSSSSVSSSSSSSSSDGNTNGVDPLPSKRTRVVGGSKKHVVLIDRSISGPAEIVAKHSQFANALQLTEDGPEPARVLIHGHTLSLVERKTVDRRGLPKISSVCLKFPAAQGYGWLKFPICKSGETNWFVDKVNRNSSCMVSSFSRLRGYLPFGEQSSDFSELPPTACVSRLEHWRGIFSRRSSCCRISKESWGDVNNFCQFKLRKTGEYEGSVRSPILMDPMGFSESKLSYAKGMETSYLYSREKRVVGPRDYETSTTGRSLGSLVCPVYSLCPHYGTSEGWMKKRMKLHSSMFLYPSDVLRQELAVSRNYSDSVLTNRNPKHVNCRDPEFVMLNETAINTVFRALSMKPVYSVAKTSAGQWVLDESRNGMQGHYDEGEFELFSEKFEKSGGRLNVLQPAACVDSFPSPNWW